MLSWSVITEQLKSENETKQVYRMLDDMPVNVMLADKDSLEITYINKTSIETLKPLQEHLPVPADELLGQCIDVFHKDPSHQRKLLGLVFVLDLICDHAPAQHRPDIFVAFIDGAHIEIENLAAHLDLRLVRKIARVSQELALMFGVFMENIETLADDVLGLAGQRVLLADPSNLPLQLSIGPIYLLPS